VTRIENDTVFAIASGAMAGGIADRLQNHLSKGLGFPQSPASANARVARMLQNIIHAALA
jgi:hypothetical protein